MSQGGFKSLICPPVFAKPSVLSAGSAARQVGQGGGHLHCFSRTSSSPPGRGFGPQPPLRLCLVGHILSPRREENISLAGFAESPKCACKACYPPSQGWQRERGYLPSPHHRNLLIWVTEASFWSSKSRSPPWLLSTHQLRLPASLPPQRKGFQQAKGYEMPRASFCGGAKTGAERWQNRLEKSTKQPVPSQALGRRRTASRATVRWGWLRQCPPWYAAAKPGTDEGRGEGDRREAEPEPHLCGMLQGRAGGPGERVNGRCYPEGPLPPQPRCHRSRGTRGTAWCRGTGRAAQPNVPRTEGCETRESSLRCSADTAP